MRKIKYTIFPPEQRIVSEEFEKAKLEQQLHALQMREYKIAANNDKTGGIV